MKLKRVQVGVRYCVNHEGIANEDMEVCDFADGVAHDGLPVACAFRNLYRFERG